MKKLLVFAMVIGIVPSLMGMEDAPKVMGMKDAPKVMFQLGLDHFVKKANGKVEISKDFSEGLKSSFDQFSDLAECKPVVIGYIEHTVVKIANRFLDVGFQNCLVSGKAQSTFRDAFSNCSAWSKGGMGLAAVVFTGFALNGVYAAGLSFNQWRKKRNKN